MKPPSFANVIKGFLDHVDKGYILSREDSLSGGQILETVANAFREILAGVDPDKALRIKRESGPPQEALTYAMALEIHKLRNDKVPWGNIHRIMEIYFEQAGRKPPSVERLKAIRKKNREWLEGIDNAAAVVEWVVREDEKRAEKK